MEYHPTDVLKFVFKIEVVQLRICDKTLFLMLGISYGSFTSSLRLMLAIKFSTLSPNLYF